MLVIRHRHHASSFKSRRNHAKEDDQNAEGKIDIILKLDAEILDAAKEEDEIKEEIEQADLSQ